MYKFSHLFQYVIRTVCINFGAEMFGCEINLPVNFEFLEYLYSQIN